MAAVTEVADRSDAVLCSTCYVGFAVGVHTAFLSLNGYGCDGDCDQMKGPASFSEIHLFRNLCMSGFVIRCE